jgi:hypothetical protein
MFQFYLKHIEENLGEIKSVYDALMSKKTDSSEDNDGFADQAHKLALNGHKLLFICDTLQRNLNNVNIKACLTESSAQLCDSLKLYMIRVKSVCANKQASRTETNPAVMDALNNVWTSSNKFKQIILKYYFKSY